MFSSVKKFAAICIVLSIVCAAASVLCLMLLAPSELVDNTLLICIVGFTGSVTLLSLIVSFTLWNLASELSIHVDSNFADFRNLKNRIETLEKQNKT